MAVAVSLRAANPDDTPKFPVSRFELAYGHAHPGLPPLTALAALKVSLVHTAAGYAAQGDGPRVEVSLDQSFDAGTLFSDSALRNVFAAVVARLNKQGLVGVYVLADPAQIDAKSREDLRPAGTTDLRLVVWASQVAQVRTIASGSRFNGKNAILNPKERTILKDSPLVAGRGDQPGSLLNKPVLDDYLRRLDRLPGRNVDAAVSASELPGDVVLDYLVNENKPWYAYAQVSNTGTAVTDKLSEQVGAVDNELTGHDDIASLGYITSNLTKANAVFGSYNYPLWFPDYLRVRGYGSWGDFQASTPSLSSEVAFTGSTDVGGAEFIYSPFALSGFAIDVIGGGDFQHVTVNDKLQDSIGTANLLEPYLQLRADHGGEEFNFTGSVGWTANLSSIPVNELDNLGRFNTTDRFSLVTGEVSASAFLDPIFGHLFGSGGGSAFINEIAFSAKGQYALGNKRLIPQAEQTAGGFFSVRGYPESAVAGDDVVVTSAEYRFHIPRLLSPQSADTKAGKGGASDQPGSLFGRPFNFRPPTRETRPDWDLILRGFFDAGLTEDNQIERPTERNYELASFGTGLELKVYSNLDLRADVGVPLNSIKTSDGINDAKAGSARVHFLASFVW